MENEEKKCCMNGDCEKCKGKKMGMCCGHGGCGGKCHMIRRIVCIVIIIIAFCLGVQWGERKGEFRGGDRFENSKRGSVTVQVQPNTIAPVTPTTTTQ